VFIVRKEFEDTNGAIKIRKKDRQCNGQEKKDKRTNNDLQSTTHKVKDQATRTGDEHMCSIKVSSSCSTSCARRVTLDTNPQWLPSLGNPGPENSYCTVAGYNLSARNSPLGWHVKKQHTITQISEWVGDCCLAPIQQYFSYVMARTS
jgi:putative hemolysin